jgi:mRNA interferase MazF
VVIRRGDIAWADVGGRRPVLVVQAQAYNDSRLPTVVVVVLTSDTRLATMPGAVFLPAVSTGLAQDAVADVTAPATVPRGDLGEPVGSLPAETMDAIGRGLRGVLGL